jgi:hypothetical protein
LPGYDVVIWGDGPDDMEACCVNGDLAGPGDDDHLLATAPPGDGDDGATAGDDPT